MQFSIMYCFIVDLLVIARPFCFVSLGDEAGLAMKRLKTLSRSKKRKLVLEREELEQAEAKAATVFRSELGC